MCCCSFAIFKSANKNTRNPRWLEIRSGVRRCPDKSWMICDGWSRLGNRDRTRFSEDNLFAAWKISRDHALWKVLHMVFCKNTAGFFPQLSAPVQKVGVQLGENVWNSRKTSIHIKTPIKSSMYYNVGGTIETNWLCETLWSSKNKNSFIKIPIFKFIFVITYVNK